MAEIDMVGKTVIVDAAASELARARRLAEAGAYVIMVGKSEGEGQKPQTASGFDEK